MTDSEVWKKFEANAITHSAAHHLIAIHELKEERGYARVTDIAKHLNITTGSVSINLKGLKAKGLIEEDDNKFLSLTSDGLEIASAVMKTKEALVKFFTEILGVSDSQADIDACKVEHLLSAETSIKLRKYLKSHT